MESGIWIRRRCSGVRCRLERQSADAGAIRALLDKARGLGAHLAGIASVDDLRGADDATWPEGAESIVVVALAHPRDSPEMDWWFGKTDPPGNRILAGIVQSLCDWIPVHLGFRTTHLPYHVDRGGAYLKDAAVLAGLGCIGLSNLLVTPEHGPRVRLRALTIDARLVPTGPIDFDPCRDCAAPCRVVCPQGAFGRLRWAAPASGTPASAASGARLPARTGDFSRSACYVQMDCDIDAATLAEPGLNGPARVIRYCRACELSCPVGA
jgi:epoxyqueuosine reductase